MNLSGAIPFLIILLMLKTFSVFSQSVKTQDPEYPLISFRSSPKFFLTLDKTSSFVSGKGAVTNEIRIGLEFQKKLRLGIGYAALVSDVVEDKTITTQISQKDSVLKAILSLSYFSISGEYIFYDSKRWQITMPVSLGIGSSYFNYYEKINGEYLTKKTDEGTVVLFGPTGVATYRVLRWVGVSGGIGFRYAIVDNSKVKESFNSPIYLIRLRIFVGEIYKSVFPRGLFGKHDPPYTNEYWD